MTRFSLAKPIVATSVAALAMLSLNACESRGPKIADTTGATVAGRPDVSRRMQDYTSVHLSTDTSTLTAKERQMIPLLVDAARAMDPIFWQQTYGSRDSLLAMTSDPQVKRFIDINYGPYDRLDENTPFVGEIGARKPGANLYPADITKEQFESALKSASPAKQDSLKGLYTIVRRGKDSTLTAIPYHIAFAEQNKIAAEKLREAASLPKIPGSGSISNCVRVHCLMTSTKPVISRGWT